MLLQTLNNINHITHKTPKSHYKTYTGCFLQNKPPFDLFQSDKISFKKAEGPSQKTLDYITQVRKDLKTRGQELKSLSQLELDKIEDIAKGITVFEGWSSYDLAFVSNKFEAILLQRGCPHQCIHCGSDSELKITSMQWDNFKAIAEGMGELKNRLGFNIFKLEKKDIVYPFHDSDPMIYKAKTEVIDANGNKQTVNKDIYDAAKLFYENTKTPFHITTAGWSPNNLISQNAALKFVKNPTIVKKIDLSISPFHHHLELSRTYEKLSRNESSPSKKEELMRKSQEMRNLYINMIADNLFTLWPLTKDNKLTLIELYDVKNKEYDNITSFEIIKDIFKKLQEKERLSEKLDPPLNNSSFYPLFSDKQIKYIGRANKFLKSISNSQFNAEKFYKEAIQNPDLILDRPVEINIDGSILINALENPEWTGDVRSYLFQFKNKKLNLPQPQTIKTTKELPLISWPPEDYLKKVLN